MKSPEEKENNPINPTENPSTRDNAILLSKDTFLERSVNNCPYCESRDFVKRGVRQNKHQQVQLFICREYDCGKTFTGRAMKGSPYPWPAVLDAISYVNLGFACEQVPAVIEKKYGVLPAARTVASWYEQSKELCRFERMRKYAKKILSLWQQKGKKDGVKFYMVETTTLAHRQLYRFRYHRPKLILLLEEYKNKTFTRLLDYLDTVATDTPHQYFEKGARMSEVRSKFDLSEVVIKGKENYANHIARFVLQGVPKNTQRHEELQRFFIANDSVTIATEVPVYIQKEDVIHFEKVLKFSVTEDGDVRMKGNKNVEPFPAILTGHIDLVQVRNGVVHILDYKPHAENERPVEQLTWYALALSRRTGLRLRDFKCAWFDEKSYYEFYPLHIVKKLQRTRTKRIHYRDGSVATIPKDNKATYA